MVKPVLLSGAVVAIGVIAACSSDSTPAANGSSSSSSSGASGNSSTSSSGATTNDAGGTGGGISDKVALETVHLQVAGNDRDYIVATPTSYDASKKYPLIVALHGDGETAADFASFSKLTLATTDQAIVAFTDHVIDLFTAYGDNPDQQLVAATIDDVKSKKSIDASKVWGFGYSKGAFMLNELGCRKPGLFAAYASHAGGAPQERDPQGMVQCPGAQAAPWLITMGGDDDPPGGQFEADYWAGLAGCSGSQDTTPATPAYCVKYNGCNPAAPLVYCSIANQAHYPLYDNAAIDSWNWFKTL